MLEVGVDVDAQFRPIKRHAHNNYLQDRAAMAGGDSFTGIPGIPNQDIAMWESMGPIADRTQERLGASDIAIVQFRRLMIDAARAFTEEARVIGHIAAAASAGETPLLPGRGGKDRCPGARSAPPTRR